MAGVGLMMIVKDEAHVVERCLASVQSLVDWWVVADTGSTDGTQDVVRRALAGIPGELVERDWVDFGHNRQEVLDLARVSPHRGPDDWAVWLDADDYFTDVDQVPRGWGLDPAQDGYFLRVDWGGHLFSRIQVVRLDRPWRWRDPLHEYLDLPHATCAELAVPGVRGAHEGARSRDPLTSARDLAVLEAGLAADPDDMRLHFYLAQTRRDAGQLEGALEEYRVRAGSDTGWAQERWYAAFQAAVVSERLGRPVADVVDAYLEAYALCWWRAEPLVELARLERGRERHPVALLFARTAATLPQPDSQGLLVDVDAYRWRRWDELAMASWWTGRYADSVAAAETALGARPDDPRLQANLERCRASLPSVHAPVLRPGGRVTGR